MYRFLLLMGSLFVIPLSVAWAQAGYAENSPLSFGTFALKNNTAAYTYVIQRNNSKTIDSRFVMIVDGQNADLDLINFPASTTLNISMPDTSLSAAGTGMTFTVRNFDYPATVVTNGVGTAVNFRFGATLETSGSGSMYPDAAYSGDATINITW